MDPEIISGKDSLENLKADWSVMVHWVELFEPKFKKKHSFLINENKITTSYIITPKIWN